MKDTEKKLDGILAELVAYMAIGKLHTTEARAAILQLIVEARLEVAQKFTSLAGGLYMEIEKERKEIQ